MSKIPKGWVHSTLENILSPQDDGKLIHQGWSPQCEREPAEDGEWGILKTTAVQDGFFLEDENKKLPHGKEPRARLEVKAQDFLMTCAGPRVRCGVTTLVRVARKKLMISGKIYRFRVDDRFVEPLFLESWLRTKESKDYIDSLKTGISESGLNLTQARFKPLPVVIAPLAEQKRIVEKLDEVLAQVDTIKARLDGIPALLKRFRQSVLASAVSGKLTEEWRENLELSWENVTLSEIISPERPISYGVLKPGDYVKDGVVLLRIKDILGDLVSLDSPHRISNELSEQYKRTLLKGDEILISLVGTLGRIALVPKSLEGANVHRNLGVVVPKQGVVSKFVFYLMKSPSIQEQIEKSRTGANQPLLNLGDIKKFAVQLPEPSEQKEIVRLVDQYFAFADTIEAQVKKAQARVDNLTQSILAKAFRGELVPQDPNDEPADKLLERITQARKEAEALAKAAKKAEAAKKRAAKSA